MEGGQDVLIPGPGGAEYKSPSARKGAVGRLVRYAGETGELSKAGEIAGVSVSLARLVAERIEGTLEAEEGGKETLVEQNNRLVGALLAIPEWNGGVLRVLGENRARVMDWFGRVKGLSASEFDRLWDGMVAEAVAARLWKKVIGGDRELVQEVSADVGGIDFYDVIEIRGKRFLVGLQVKSVCSEDPGSVKVDLVESVLSQPGVANCGPDSVRYRSRMLQTLTRVCGNEMGGENVVPGVVLMITMGVGGKDGWMSLMRMVDNEEVVDDFRQQIRSCVVVLGY